MLTSLRPMQKFIGLKNLVSQTKPGPPTSFSRDTYGPCTSFCCSENLCSTHPGPRAKMLSWLYVAQTADARTGLVRHRTQLFYCPGRHSQDRPGPLLDVALCCPGSCRHSRPGSQLCISLRSCRHKGRPGLLLDAVVAQPATKTGLFCYRTPHCLALAASVTAQTGLIYNLTPLCVAVSADAKRGLPNAFFVSQAAAKAGLVVFGHRLVLSRPLPMPGQVWFIFGRQSLLPWLQQPGQVWSAIGHYFVSPVYRH